MFKFSIGYSMEVVKYKLLEALLFIDRTKVKSIKKATF